MNMQKISIFLMVSLFFGVGEVRSAVKPKIDKGCSAESSLLYLALQAKNYSMAQQLFAAGGRLRKMESYLLLLGAIDINDSTSVSQIIQCGADVNESNRDDSTTPLYSAIKYNFFHHGRADQSLGDKMLRREATNKIINDLLAAKAQLNKGDKLKLFKIALKDLDIENVKDAIRFCGDAINTPDDSKKTPLHLAMEYNNSQNLNNRKKIIEELFKAGAEVPIDVKLGQVDELDAIIIKINNEKKGELFIQSFAASGIQMPVYDIVSTLQILPLASEVYAERKAAAKQNVKKVN